MIKYFDEKTWGCKSGAEIFFCVGNCPDLDCSATRPISRRAPLPDEKFCFDGKIWGCGYRSTQFVCKINCPQLKCAEITKLTQKALPEPDTKFSTGCTFTKKTFLCRGNCPGLNCQRAPTKRRGRPKKWNKKAN